MNTFDLKPCSVLLKKQENYPLKDPKVLKAEREEYNSTFDELLKLVDDDHIDSNEDSFHESDEEVKSIAQIQNFSHGESEIQLIPSEYGNDDTGVFSFFTVDNLSLSQYLSKCKNCELKHYFLSFKPEELENKILDGLTVLTIDPRYLDFIEGFCTYLFFSMSVHHNKKLVHSYYNILVNHSEEYQPKIIHILTILFNWGLNPKILFKDDIPEDMPVQSGDFHESQRDIPNLIDNISMITDYISGSIKRMSLPIDKKIIRTLLRAFIISSFNKRFSDRKYFMKPLHTLLERIRESTWNSEDMSMLIEELYLADAPLCNRVSVCGDIYSQSGFGRKVACALAQRTLEDQLNHPDLLKIMDVPNFNKVTVIAFLNELNGLCNLNANETYQCLKLIDFLLNGKLEMNKECFEAVIEWLNDLPILLPNIKNVEDRNILRIFIDIMKSTMQICGNCKSFKLQMDD